MRREGAHEVLLPVTDALIQRAISLHQRGYVEHFNIRLTQTATCKRCGCVVMAGPDEDWTRLHDQWHQQQEQT